MFDTDFFLEIEMSDIDVSNLIGQLDLSINNGIKTKNQNYTKQIIIYFINAYYNGQKIFARQGNGETIHITTHSVDELIKCIKFIAPKKYENLWFFNTTTENMKNIHSWLRNKANIDEWRIDHFFNNTTLIVAIKGQELATAFAMVFKGDTEKGDTENE